MTRDDAIALRCRQLAGERTDPDQLAEALALIAQPAPWVYNGRGRPPKGVTVPPKAQRQLSATNRIVGDPPGLLGARARANRALLNNLRKVMP